MSDVMFRTAMDPADPPEVSKRQVVRVVVRRGGPKLLEATVVPAVLFYAALLWGGVGLAYVAAVLWIYGCVLWRVVRGRTVHTILILGAIGITLRTALAIGTGSTFVYFAQPIMLTVVTAGLFLATLWVGRPMIERLAGDFWPVTPEMAANPRVHALFRGLTLLWAGVNLANAILTFVLLVTVPLVTFVAVKQVVILGINAIAVMATISWAHHIACGEGIVARPGARAGLQRRPPQMAAAVR